MTLYFPTIRLRSRILYDFERRYLSLPSFVGSPKTIATDARLALRPQLEDEAKESIQKDIPGEKVSTWDYLLSAQETDRQLGEDGMERWFAEQKRLRRMEQAQRERGERAERERKPKNRGMER